jgi:hypothetical protein
LCCLLLVGGLYLAFDRWAAVSLVPGVVALACLASLPGTVLLGYGHSRVVRLALPALAIGFFLSVSAIDWDTRKPFLRAFNAIEVGMTVEEVDRRMAAYIRAPQAVNTLADGTLAYRHTTAGWGDADIGIVSVADGRVTARVFYPD